MLHNTVLYLRTVLNLGPESSNLTSESAFITKLSHSKHDGVTYEKAWNATFGFIRDSQFYLRI